MKRILALAAVVAVSSLLPFGASPAQAATITVDSLDDSGPGSLRQAILDSNASVGVTDEIVFEVTGRIELVLPLPELSDDVAIIGPGADDLVIDGNGNLILEVIADAFISGITFTGGSNPFGGAIVLSTGGSSLLLLESVVTDNSATFGGGIYSNGSLNVIQSSISGNHANSFGGALFQSSGTALVLSSLIAGNDSDAFAGGVYKGAGNLFVVNSTVSGNTSSSFGGGIYNQDGETNLVNVTLAGNDSLNGGGIYLQDGVARALNTIFAKNTGENCNEPISSTGHNLDDDGTCGLDAEGDIVGVDALLGPLADNGGPTLTHALLNGSPAIDAALDEECPSVDQRGVSRPQGDGCDMGAYEVEEEKDEDEDEAHFRPRINRAGAMGGVLVAASEAAARNRARAAAVAAPPPLPAVAPPSTGEAGLLLP